MKGSFCTLCRAKTNVEQIYIICGIRKVLSSRRGTSPRATILRNIHVPLNIESFKNTRFGDIIKIPIQCATSHKAWTYCL